MARSLVYVPNVTYSDGVSSFQLPRGVSDLALTGAGGPRPGAVLIDSGSEVEVALGLTAPGFVLVYNRDPDNFVKVGFTTGVYGLMIPAGFAMPLYLMPTQTSLFCLADTDDCVVEIFGFDA